MNVRCTRGGSSVGESSIRTGIAGRNGVIWLLSLAAICLLPSCGTRHAALRFTRSGGEQPAHYGEVATSGAMESSAAEVFGTGPAIEKQMLKMINSATDYILIDTFLLSADETTMEVLEALKRKHRSGVRIYVLTDSSSRLRQGRKDVFRFLEEAGIPNTEYNPMRVYKLVVAPVMLPRDHRKFWIVDGKTLFLGGANLFFTSLRSPEANGNRDFMVAVESAEAVARMTASFVASWNRYSSEKLHAESFRVRARSREMGQLWLTDQNKDAGRRDEVSRMFEGLFAVARDEIWLVQPYAFVTSDMIRQFRSLTGRGVTVNVILSGKVHSPRFHLASHYGIKDILKAGGKVWIYRPENGPLHAKAAVVDGRWASVGSANLNARSYHLSNEANLVLGDPKSLGRVKRVLDDIRKGCREVGMEEAERYRGTHFYLTWLLMQVLG